MYQCINLKMSQFENLKMLLMYQCVNVEMSWSLKGIRHCESTWRTDREPRQRSNLCKGIGRLPRCARLKFGQVRLTVGHA